MSGAQEVVAGRVYKPRFVPPPDCSPASGLCATCCESARIIASGNLIRPGVGDSFSVNEPMLRRALEVVRSEGLVLPEKLLTKLDLDGTLTISLGRRWAVLAGVIE